MPMKVFMKPSCLPAKEYTWILDFTQSMGMTINQRQAPAKPPLNMSGRIPAETIKHFVGAEPNKCLINYKGNIIQAYLYRLYLCPCAART